MSDDLDRSSTISVMKYRLHARQCNTDSTPFPSFVTGRQSGYMEITHTDNRGTVLVVDGDAVFLVDLSQILQSDGYTVVQAQTEAEALECARASRPDVVLIDVRLGDSSGIETLSRLCNVLDDSVFVVMSAHADVESAIGAIQSGAHDYIHKPFPEESVRLVVARCSEVAALGRAKAAADAESSRRPTIRPVSVPRFQHDSHRA
jgi:DNA-binding NtrC family response regulator